MCNKHKYCAPPCRRQWHTLLKYHSSHFVFWLLAHLHTYHFFSIQSNHMTFLHGRRVSRHTHLRMCVYSFTHSLTHSIQDLFVICCGGPKFWSRQQAARTSNIRSPWNSIKWINVNQAVWLKVGFYALGPSRSRTSTFTRAW